MLSRPAAWWIEYFMYSEKDKDFLYLFFNRVTLFVRKTRCASVVVKFVNCVMYFDMPHSRNIPIRC